MYSSVYCVLIEDAAFVKAYDDILKTCLANFVSASEKIGGLVNEQVSLVSVSS